MTKQQSEQTEVVKIRLGSDDKATLQEIAEKECRTFSDQCRLAIREWIKIKSARPARGAAAGTLRKRPAQQAQPETPPHRHKWVAGFNQRTGEWGEVCLICQRGRRIGRVR